MPSSDTSVQQKGKKIKELRQDGEKHLCTIQGIRISKLFKELKKVNNTIQNGLKIWIDTFSKEDIKMF